LPEAPPHRPPTPPPPWRSSSKARAPEREGRVRRCRGRALYEQALAKDPGCGPALWESAGRISCSAATTTPSAPGTSSQALTPDDAELKRYYPVLIMRRDQGASARELARPVGVLPAPEEEPRDGPHLTITAVGDVQMGRAWPEANADIPPRTAPCSFANVRTC